MNNVLTLVFLFFFGSVIGWGIETVFRRFTRENTEKKWINPGFLIGPYLPLYGFGVCTLYLFYEFEDIIPIENEFLLSLLTIFLMGIAMTVLELIAGLIFIKGMNLKLWDYTNKPFNYKGIICPEFSVYWTILAAFYYFFIHKYILDAINLFNTNLTVCFIVGVICGIFIIDLSYSFNLASKIRHFASENNVLIRYEELKRNIRRHTEETKEKYRFLFAFRTKASLYEHLKIYFETQKQHKDKKSSH